MVFDCCGPRGWQDQARRAAQRLPRSQGSSVHVAMLGINVHVAPSRQFKHGTWGLERKQPVWLSTRQDDHLSKIQTLGCPHQSPQNHRRTKRTPPKKVGPLFLSSDIQNKNVATTIWTCPCSSRVFGATSKLLALWQRFGMVQALGLKTPYSWRKRSVLGKVFSLMWRTVPTSKPFLELLETSWFKATRANGCGLARVCLNYKTLPGPMLNRLTCIFNIWNVL